jgi:hypothetical protein
MFTKKLLKQVPRRFLDFVQKILWTAQLEIECLCFWVFLRVGLLTFFSFTVLFALTFLKGLCGGVGF